jgi:uncharacterized RDD family membrane protein YckC
MEEIAVKTSHSPTSVSLFRHFAALFYDSLLLASVLFFATGLFQWLTQGNSPLIVFRIYLLMVWFGYFAWPWLRSGQTLGMSAWKIQLQTMDGKPLSWQHVSQRFLMAIVSWLVLGMGFFWAVVDKQHRTWHDLASHTRLVYIS